MAKTGAQFLASIVVLGLACGGPRPPSREPGADDPDQPGLAFARVPAAARLNGRFEVWVRVNGERGAPQPSGSPEVTVRASGSGVLRGTLTRRATGGLAIFDDLSYDAWEPITLTVQTPGLAPATTRSAFPVRPVIRFVQMPPVHVPAKAALGPMIVELVDGRGKAIAADHPVTLEVAGGPASHGPAGNGRSFAAGGQASFEGLVVETPGRRTLVWRSPGLSDLVHGLTVHEGEAHRSLWLPSGRVGVEYFARLPSGSGKDEDYRILRGMLPRGLKLEPSGEIHGVPSAAQPVQLEIFATATGGSSSRWSVWFSIFPAAEVAAAPSIDALDVEGRFAVKSLDEQVAVPSRKTITRVRVFYPAGPDGAPAEGPFPLVVFHHGAAPYDPLHPRLFDRFDPLLRRWASHGFVVATIDALELVWNQGRLVSATLSNMNLMSENQRATMAFLRARNDDADWPLRGRVDGERVIVAGHSRGGGASVITARAEPAVVGGILIKPLDPMATVGGERVWSGELPPKPFLVVAAGNDGDLPYPMVDFLYERRAAPMALVTILGSLHNFTCDGCAPEPGATAEIERSRDWALTNAYALAFLNLVGRDQLGYAPLLFGVEASSTRLSPQGVLVRADRGARGYRVDDFQDDVLGRNQLGLSSGDDGLVWSADESWLVRSARQLPDGYDFFRTLYERADLLARSRAHRLEWDRDGASWRTDLGGLDVRPLASFVFRACSDERAVDGARLAVRFEDSEGNVATLEGAGRVSERGIGRRFSDVIVPVTAIRAAGVDVGALSRIELVMSGAGALFIDDLRFE